LSFAVIDARIVFVAAVLCSPSVRADDATFSNLGEGLSSCGDWLDKRHKTPSRVIPEAAWVLGFLTAASQYNVTASPKNIAHGLTVNGIEHWIDNYCAAHPLDNIDTAASSLVSELATR
jgi:hypothetical protein